MRTSLLAICALASVTSACATARAMPVRHRAHPSSLSAGSPTGRFETEPVQQWWLLEVGPRARSLVLEYRQGGGCDFPAKATLRQTRTTIRVTLRQKIYLPGPGEACTDELTMSRLVVHLGSPVRGRHVVQPASPAQVPFIYLNRPAPDPRYSDILLALVPRVIGLSPADAKRVLRQEGFHAIIQGHGSEVIRQYPSRGRRAPGTTPSQPFAGIVRLVTGH